MSFLKVSFLKENIIKMSKLQVVTLYPFCKICTKIAGSEVHIVDVPRFNLEIEMKRARTFFSVRTSFFNISVERVEIVTLYRHGKHQTIVSIERSSRGSRCNATLQTLVGIVNRFEFEQEIRR